jgi:hypothetical protein
MRLDYVLNHHDAENGVNWMTNATIFAPSFSGKWGDYDPQGIEKWEPEPPAADSPSEREDDGL